MKKQISYLLALCMTASCMVVPAVTAHADDASTTLKHSKVIATFPECDSVTGNNQQEVKGINYTASNKLYRSDWGQNDFTLVDAKKDFQLNRNYLNLAGAAGTETANENYFYEADIAISALDGNDALTAKVWDRVVLTLRASDTATAYEVYNNNDEDQNRTDKERRTNNFNVKDYITGADDTTPNTFHICVPLNAITARTDRSEVEGHDQWKVDWDQIWRGQLDVYLSNNISLDTSTSPVHLNISNKCITASNDATSYDYAALTELKNMDAPTNTDYTADSFKTYADAVTSAKELNTAATPEIASKYQAINQAKMGLVKQTPENAVIKINDAHVNTGNSVLSPNWMRFNAIDLSNPDRRSDFSVHVKITANMTGSDEIKSFKELIGNVFMRIGNSQDDHWDQYNYIQNKFSTGDSFTGNNSIEITIPLSTTVDSHNTNKPADWSTIDQIYFFAYQGTDYVGKVTLDFTEIWITDSKNHYQPVSASYENTYVATITPDTDTVDNSTIKEDTYATAVLSTISANDENIESIKWTWNGITKESTTTIASGSDAIFALILSANIDETSDFNKTINTVITVK